MNMSIGRCLVVAVIVVALSSTHFAYSPTDFPWFDGYLGKSQFVCHSNPCPTGILDSTLTVSIDDASHNLTLTAPPSSPLSLLPPPLNGGQRQPPKKDGRTRARDGSHNGGFDDDREDVVLIDVRLVATEPGRQFDLYLGSSVRNLTLKTVAFVTHSYMSLLVNAVDLVNMTYFHDGAEYLGSAGGLTYQLQPTYPTLTVTPDHHYSDTVFSLWGMALDTISIVKDTNVTFSYTGGGVYGTSHSYSKHGSTPAN